MNKSKILFSTFIIIIILSGCSVKKAKLKITGVDCEKFVPVCGEDGVTYYNQCQAEEKDTEISYEGACTGLERKSLPYEKVEISNESK